MVSIRNWMLLIRSLWANSMIVLSLSISNHVTDVCKWRYTMRRGLSSFRACLCACYSVQRVTLCCCCCCCSESFKHINYKTTQRANRNEVGESQLSLPKRNSPFREWVGVASASSETLRGFPYKYFCRILQYHFLYVFHRYFKVIYLCISHLWSNLWSIENWQWTTYMVFWLIIQWTARR